MAHVGSILVFVFLGEYSNALVGTVMLHLHNYLIVLDKEEMKITLHGSTGFSHWRAGFRDNLVLRLLNP